MVLGNLKIQGVLVVFHEPDNCLGRAMPRPRDYRTKPPCFIVVQVEVIN